MYKEEMDYEIIGNTSRLNFDRGRNDTEGRDFCQDFREVTG